MPAAGHASSPRSRSTARRRAHVLRRLVSTALAACAACTARQTTTTASRPHWLAQDAGSDRVIVGAEHGGENRMLMARVDARTGHLRWDESLRAADGTLGIGFQREGWPHGATGEAFGHTALFRP